MNQTSIPRTCSTALLLLTIFVLNSPAQSPDEALKREAAAALRKAVEFHRTKVARGGGYVYYTSLDLKQRWGEGKADENVIFTQPPGTPTVGMAYLKASQATGDPYYLDAARETALSLTKGQSPSGGWPQSFDVTGETPKRKPSRSSLDDGQTQSCIEFLCRLDGALKQQDREVHALATRGLEGLLSAQFPNGAFPQSWIEPAAKHPVLQAKYPEYDWRVEGRVKNYWDYYTLNDNLAGSVSTMLIVAHQTYGEAKYLEALKRLGDFLIAAQMPDPQPAWCQQYNYEMVPIWARKFEPPAIAGSESQDVMETLIEIARHTGDKKYLAPLSRALDYFEKRCVLPDGKMARFYELKTNKPLYMTKEYELTYDDGDVPSHYGWKKSQHFAKIRRDYEKALKDLRPVVPKAKVPSDNDVKAIIKNLDDQGRWVSTAGAESLTGNPKFPKGFQYLSSQIFADNVDALSRFLKKQED